MSPFIRSATVFTSVAPIDDGGAVRSAFIIALIFLAAPIFGYVAFRNTKVDEDAKWDYAMGVISGKLSEAREAQAAANVSLTFQNQDGSARPLPSSNDANFDIHGLWQNVLDYSVARDCERLSMVVTTEKVAIVALIDGVKYPIDAPPPQTAMSMLNYMKQQAGMDATDMRRRQSGKVWVHLGDMGRHGFTVNSVGSSKEVRLNLIADAETTTRLSFGELGLLDSQQSQLDSIVGGASGVVLVACPAGQGMTTTMYNLVERHDPYTQSVLTLEDSVAYEIEGVDHELIEPGTTPDAIAKNIVVKLRSDPNVLMVSKLFDAQVAGVIAEGAEVARFYTGLHQSDTFTALRTWIKAVGDPKRAASALTAIVSQRLVRKLCPTCRVVYQPDPAMLQKLNLPADKVQQLFKHSGKLMVGKREEACPDCMGIGYRGRVGVFEMMVLDDEARELIATAHLDQARAHLRKQRMLLLQEAALSKVVQGVTSLSEVQRALAKEEK